MDFSTFAPKALRRLLLAWLAAVTAEFLLVMPELSGVEGLAAMSLGRVVFFTIALSAVLWLSKWDAVERWAFPVVFTLLALACLRRSYTRPFALACLGVLAVMLVYAWKSWRREAPEPVPAQKEDPLYRYVTAALAVGFFLFVSAWTVGRVNSFSTPSYDFGIFSQMFYSMRTQGAPITTLERDGALSHFAVHVSPIYYLMLPFYALVPTPATLQVLQAAVLASAVIPLWLLGKRHGLSPQVRTLLCALALLYPAFSGGTSYDIHENCFLTPLLLWLFYGIDSKRPWLIALAAVLTLGVKEDAAVYTAVVGLYLLVCAWLQKDKGHAITGTALLAGSLLWFFAVTGYLAQKGDGVMTYRYRNFMFDGEDSLLGVVKAVILCPMKAVFECMDAEKLKFLAQTMIPLLGLPLLTRRYERYLLLIPYVLVNLMSDYTYQHDILFQYTFGSTAFLFYLVSVNLADMKLDFRRISALGAALVVCAGFFGYAVAPTAITYIQYPRLYAGFYQGVRDTLDTIPEDASVTATTFYTTYLSQRDILYDVGYCSKEHLFSTDYVVLNLNADSSCTKYGGIKKLIDQMEDKGYTLHARYGDTLAIYKSPAAP